ncbi:MAG: GGDEF domain-containing protein [Pseudomonadota bacterium]
MAAVTLGPMISVVITIPASFFIWSQVRKNARLSAELQRLVNRDRLTDVATRDFFFEKMSADPSAFGTSLMVDIDYFKDVNDTFGHFAGDIVIARVAEILKTNTRKHDIVCRFGGEEFVIFLYDHDRQAGFETAERMRKAIAESLISIEKHEVRVTVSIGGSLKERVKDLERAIQEADRALYRAKTGGRNQTIFATDGDYSAAAEPAVPPRRVSMPK